jgi:hypothetical protein
MRSRVIDRDLGWKRTLKALAGTKGAYFSVGLHSDAKPYESGQEGPATVAQIAGFHEFGSKDGEHPPARPFLRPTIDGNREKYAVMLERVLGLVIDGKLTLKKALGLVGTQVATDVKQAITDVTSPPLAPSTLAHKAAKAAHVGKEGVAAYIEAGGNPLIDTGHMRHSVTYKVSIADKEPQGPESVAGGEE